MVSAVPDIFHVRLKYVSNNTLVTAAATTLGHVFTMNGLFDPDVTGAGAQPLGFDQWMAFYAKYRVISSSITVRANNLRTVEPVMLNLVPSRDSALLTDVSEIAEQPYSTKKIMSPRAGGNDTVRLNNHLSIAKFAGIRSVNYDTQYSGNSSTNPDRPFFWQVYFTVVDGVGLEINATFQTEIVYTVELYNRNPLSGS